MHQIKRHTFRTESLKYTHCSQVQRSNSHFKILGFESRILLWKSASFPNWMRARTSLTWINISSLFFAYLNHPSPLSDSNHLLFSNSKTIRSRYIISDSTWNKLIWHWISYEKQINAKNILWCNLFLLKLKWSKRFESVKTVKLFFFFRI